MNIPPLGVVLSMLREAIDGPKERFEKFKRRIANLIFAPTATLFLFGTFIVGTVAVVSTGAFQTDAIEILRLALSTAAGMFSNICLLAVLVFGLSIVGNFDYKRRAERSLEAIKQLETEEARMRTYLVIRAKLLQVMGKNSTAEIRGLLGYAVHAYPYKSGGMLGNR